MTAPSTPIRNVSDTALWVAIYRAMESERPDAIFRDPFARKLAGARGEAIVAHLHRGAAMAWAMIVRTAVMDEIILRCVAQGAATVVNLAAGLDTRPYRLALPATLNWLHVDLPDMVGYVQGNLAGETPRCRLEYLSADLTNSEARGAIFQRVAGIGPTLVITEGLLIYLTAEQVRGLGREIHEVARAHWWLTDTATPRLQKMMAKRWGGQLAQGNAPMQFFPESTAFFAPLGWREAEFRSMWDESWRLNRPMKGARVWRFLSRFMPEKQNEAGRRMSGVVLLESNEA